MTKDFMKGAYNEFYRGKIFRLINSSDGLDALQIAEQLQLTDKELLSQTLKEMMFDGLIVYDTDKDKWLMP